jgi:iduronate 2-sulfatase
MTRLLPLLLSLAAFAQPKNVLFIAVDDLRPELGCYGSSHMRTPHIDSLATSGLLFERAYCQQAVCGPSRIAVMTGLRPDTTKVYMLDQALDKELPDTRTLAQHFKEAGYSTASLGKMGYSLRSARWRYTEWRQTNGKVLERELYNHTRSPIASANVVDDPEHKDI